MQKFSGPHSILELSEVTTTGKRAGRARQALRAARGMCKLAQLPILRSDSDRGFLTRYRFHPEEIFRFALPAAEHAVSKADVTSARVTHHVVAVRIVAAASPHLQLLYK